MPKFKQKNGIMLYYKLLSHSNSSADTCVLIGGLTRDHTVWRKLIPLLTQDFHVLVFDNRDAGQSDQATQNYTVEELAEDVANLILHLDISPVHIIGHSMGGFVGIYLAANHSGLIKTLTLCSVAAHQLPAGKNYLTDRIQLMKEYPPKNASTASEADVRAMMERLYAPETLKNLAFVNEVVAHETQNPWPQSAVAFIRQAHACLNYDARHLMSKIRCPVLVLTGEKDPYYTPTVARDLTSHLLNAKCAIIPHAAHMVPLEQPKVLHNVFKNFITLKKNQNKMIE